MLIELFRSHKYSGIIVTILLLFIREPHNYQGQHDPVTFNLCKDSTTDVDIKFSNDSKVIGK